MQASKDKILYRFTKCKPVQQIERFWQNLNGAVIRNEHKEIKCNKNKTKVLLNGHSGQPAQHRVNCGEFEGGGDTKVSWGREKLGNRRRIVGDFRLLNLQQHFVL